MRARLKRDHNVRLPDGLRTIAAGTIVELGERLAERISDRIDLFDDDDDAPEAEVDLRPTRGEPDLRVDDPQHVLRAVKEAHGGKLNRVTVDVLEDVLDAFGINEDDIEGTGANGNVIKRDLVRTLEALDEE